MCIVILTDPLFIPIHTYLMNREDEYYVKGVYLGVVCCCFFFLLQVLSFIIRTLSFLPWRLYRSQYKDESKDL